MTNTLNTATFSFSGGDFMMTLKDKCLNNTIFR